MNQDPLNVCILGSEGVGKTCLLGGLALLTQAGSASGVQVASADSSTERYLYDLAKTLRGRRWPPGTTPGQTHAVELDLLYRGTQLRITALDYSGEELRTKANTGDEETLPELAACLGKADVLLLLFDPDIEFAEGIEPGTEEAQVHQERLDALLKMLRQCRFKGDRKPDVAIVLTKADRHPELLKDPAAVKRFFQIRPLASNVDHQVRQLARRVKHVAISAVGQIEEDPEHDSDIPALKPNPQGYEVLLDWIVRQRWWQRNRWRVVTGGAVAAVAILSLVTGLVVWETQHRRHIDLIENSNTSAVRLVQLDERIWWPRNSYYRAMDRRLEYEQARLNAQLGDDPPLTTLERLQQQIDALGQIRHTSAGDLVEQMRGRIEQQHRLALFGLVQAAYQEGSPWPRFEGRKSEFLDMYPSGDQADQVRRWAERIQKDEHQRARRRVATIASGEPGFLINKARAIERYLDRNFDDANREAKRQAAALARQLAETRHHTIRFERAGRLNARYHMGWSVEHNGQEIAEGTSNGRATVLTGNEQDRFQVNWSPGDQIRVVLRIGNWRRWWDVASIQSSDPLSLALLAGNRQMPNIHPDWRDTFHSGPVVRFAVEGLDAADWRLLHDWIHPGDRW